MKEFYLEMYSFHHQMNQEIIDYLERNEDKLSERARFLISHSILANKLWNERIEGKPFIDPNRTLGLDELREMDLDNYEKSVHHIKNMDFDKTFGYENSRGIKYNNTVGQILFQIANHFTHHRGQLMSELRTLGIRPMITDYIHVRRKRLN